MAEPAPGHFCHALVQLRRITVEELASVLASMPARSQSECTRAAGLRVRSGEPPEKVARLLKARLRSIGDAAGHNVVVALTEEPRLQMLRAVGEDPEQVVEEVSTALGGALGNWPPPLLCAMFAFFTELGGCSAEVGEELIALASSRARVPGGAPESPATPNDTQPPTTPPVEVAPPPGAAQPPAASALDAAVRKALFMAHAAGEGFEVATAAVGELLAIDGRRLGSWRLRGLADGLAGSWRLAAPSFSGAAAAHFAGVAEAMHHTAQTAELAELALAHPAHLERLADDAPELVAPVILALLEGDGPQHARLVARLLESTLRPFPGWSGVVSALEQGAPLLARPGPGAVALLRAGDAMLTMWTPALGAEELAAVERAAAGLAVARARCQRRAGDLRGARALLDRVDPELLGGAARVTMLEESAMLACNLVSLAALSFPSSAAEREAAQRRFSPAAADIEAAVGAGSRLIGPVLRAVLHVAHERTAAAVADLRTAYDALSPAGGTLPPEGNREVLLAMIEFQLGLAELCLMEAGNAEVSAERVDRGIASGHRPAVSDLSAVAVALAAHGSPRATAAVERVLRVAPDDPVAVDTLGSLARAGVEEAGALAAAMGSDSRLRRTIRYDLLDAALTAASSSACVALDAELLADQLEALVATAADPGLDQRWAQRLGCDVSLRDILGADAADLVRLDVLRRCGRVDEAAALARGLFHRCVSGHVAGVDPADLLDLVAQLGVPVEERQRMEVLLASGDKSRPSPGGAVHRDARVHVLFVGGDEAQARAASAVEREISDRLGDGVTVEWFTRGWWGHWSTLADDVERRYPEAHALVIMTFVRTLLGRRLRRSAGEAGLPWVACTGHGRASMERAIGRAVEVARVGTASGDG